MRLLRVIHHDVINDSAETICDTELAIQIVCFDTAVHVNFGDKDGRIWAKAGLEKGELKKFIAALTSAETKLFESSAGEVIQ